MSSIRVLFVYFVASLLGCFSAQIPELDSVDSGEAVTSGGPFYPPSEQGGTSPTNPSNSSSPNSGGVVPADPPSVDAGVSRCSNPGADSSRWVELNFDGRYEGAIRDQNTGLVWTFFPAKSVHGTFEFWTDQNRAETYCNNLEHAGFNDWRLPSKDELLTLVDMRYQSPASGFPCIAATTHWSADIYKRDNLAGLLGWHVSFETGVASYDGGNSGASRYFKCVR